MNEQIRSTPIETLTSREFKSEQTRVGVKFISLNARTYVLTDSRRFILCTISKKWIRCR